MQKVLAIVAVLILSTTSSLFAENKPVQRVENYLAVLELESAGKVDNDVVRPLTDCVRREIVKSGKYEVLDRGNMDKVLKEQAFQMTGCTSKECAVEAGQLLGVGKIVVGSVSMIGQTYLLSLSLVNVETGKIEWVEDKECKCEVDDLIKLSKQVAAKLMGATITRTALETPNVQSVVAKAEIPKDTRSDRETTGRYYDTGTGTIGDRATGLEWQKTPDGRTRIWRDANEYCKQLILNGKGGWRLPDKEELESIVDRERRDPAINMTSFPDTRSSSYWSSATYTNFTSVAWFVNFNSGKTNAGVKRNRFYARCVR